MSYKKLFDKTLILLRRVPRSHAPAWECILALSFPTHLQEYLHAHCFLVFIFRVGIIVERYHYPVDHLCIPMRERGNEKKNMSLVTK